MIQESLLGAPYRQLFVPGCCRVIAQQAPAATVFTNPAASRQHPAFFNLCHLYGWNTVRMGVSLISSSKGASSVGQSERKRLSVDPVVQFAISVYSAD